MKTKETFKTVVVVLISILIIGIAVYYIEYPIVYIICLALILVLFSLWNRTSEESIYTCEVLTKDFQDKIDKWLSTQNSGIICPVINRRIHYDILKSVWNGTSTLAIRDLPTELLVPEMEIKEYPVKGYIFPKVLLNNELVYLTEVPEIISFSVKK